MYIVHHHQKVSRPCTQYFSEKGNVLSSHRVGQKLKFCKKDHVNVSLDRRIPHQRTSEQLLFNETRSCHSLSRF